MTGETRKRTFGLAAILVVGTIAGFLAAAGTGGADYATVGTISDSQAFQMPVETEDQRVRFALEADQDTANEPVASFALYDPADEYFTEFELRGDGDDAEAILDEKGPWVLFVTERRNADLAVQYEADESDKVEMKELETQQTRKIVAQQDGGALDEQLAFRLDVRPASVFLEYSGDIKGLDATVSTDQGPVYGLADASANSTADGDTRAGDVTATSANLAAGAYEVEATADAFDGELAFVHVTYEREQTVEQQPPEENVEQNVTSYEESNEGSVVAEIQQGEVYEVQTAGAQALTLLADRGTEASLAIYNSSDRLVKQVEIESDHHYDYEEEWWDEDDDNESEEEANESRPQYNETTKTVDAAEEGPYMVYAQDIHGGDAVSVFVPAPDAPQAQALEVKTQETTLEGNEGSWNTTLDGALLDISAWSSDTASMDRNVTATGEAGPVLHYEQSFNSFGIATYEEHQVHPEHFTDGDLEVTMNADGIGGETHLEIVNYVR